MYKYNGDKLPLLHQAQTILFAKIEFLKLNLAIYIDKHFN